MVIVASCQIAPEFGNHEENRTRVREAVSEAASRGANIIVLPELASSGYRFRNRSEAALLAESAHGETADVWVELAREHDVVIVGGLCEADGENIYNSSLIVDNSGVLAVYRKAHLWDYEVNIFDRGSQPPPVIDTKFGRLTTVICYDLDFPEWTRLPIEQGVELICSPVNWPETERPAGERPTEIVRAQALASTHFVYVAAADRVGTERGTEWVGGSTIISPTGYPLALADRDGQDIIYAECDLPSTRNKRISEHNDTSGDRRIDLYREFTRSNNE